MADEASSTAISVLVSPTQYLEGVVIACCPGCWEENGPNLCVI